MTRYLVRIELYGNPSWQTYDRLHSAMEKRGFAKTITIDTGTVYELPTATYYRDTNSEPNVVFNEAKAAAVSVWRDCGVVSAVTQGIIVDGLRERGGKRLFGIG